MKGRRGHAIVIVHNKTGGGWDVCVCGGGIKKLPLVHKPGVSLQPIASSMSSPHILRAAKPGGLGGCSPPTI